MLPPDLAGSFKRYAILERGMNTTSCKSITRHMDALLKFVHRNHFARITTSEIRDFLYTNSQEKLWSPKTFRNYLQSFNSFYSWAQKKGLITSNPALGIEKPKLPKQLPRCLSEKDVNRTLVAVSLYPWKGDFEAVRNATIFYTFAFTGIRLKELIDLKISDVDLEELTLRVRQGKGRKERYIPIHTQLARRLKAYFSYLDNYSDLWLFPSTRLKTRLSPKTIQRMFRLISKKTGIKCTPHMLRHSFGRMCTDKNLPFFKLKEIMGHSSITMSERYASVSLKGIQESFLKLSFF